MERFSTVNKNLDDPRRIRVGHSLARLAIPNLALVVCRTRCVIRSRFIDQTT